MGQRMSLFELARKSQSPNKDNMVQKSIDIQSYAAFLDQLKKRVRDAQLKSRYFGKYGTY